MYRLRAVVTAPFLLIVATGATLHTAKKTPIVKAPIVKLSSGTLRGFFSGGTAVFKGIPYAAPPVAELRWREPQPVAVWSGIRDATKPGSACVQDPDGMDRFLQPLAATYGAPDHFEQLSSSEDCLYLNVWTLGLPPGKPLPVMVWLHGGSNVMGSGSQSAYDGATLASQGVIVVTINYRLGVMGFLSHPQLTSESPHHSSGNYGLLDQLASLAWVRANIAEFGGDPGNVTLFGESAGAIDAGMLIVSPLSAGLFRRVISESGPFFGMGQATTLAEAEKVGIEVGRLAQSGSKSPIENLRTLPASKVVQLVTQVVKTQFRGFNPGTPILDGWVLSQSPARAFASGAIQKVDLMVGLNGREFSAFRVAGAKRAQTSAEKDTSSKKDSPLKTFADGAHPLYGGWTTAAIGLYLGEAVFGKNAALDQAANDMLAACPIGAEATLTTANGNKVFLYRFDRSVPGKGEAELGAFHSLELPYVFGALQDPTWRWLPFTDVDKDLSRSIRTYWTNFAKTGNPNSPGLPQWPAWKNGEEGYLAFNRNGKPVTQRQFSPPFCHLVPDRLRKGLMAD
jgi:para-nitrobenzyl esterase